MCELLGMSFNVPVSPGISFRGFRHRSKVNPDGWGIGFYPDERAIQIIKEPVESCKSALAGFIKDYQFRSKIFICHVRKASMGEVLYRNTHPFSRELNGRDYMFAHNGTVKVCFKTHRFQVVGDTDSENVFCHLLDQVSERGIKNWTKNDFDWLRNKLEEINARGSSLNCLFSEGEHLFCYADNNFSKLLFTRRTPPYEKIHLRDEHWDIDLPEVKDPHEKGFIVATQTLTDEQWQSFLPGELIVFRDGAMVYSSDREISEDAEVLAHENEILVLKVIRCSPGRISYSKIREKLKGKLSETEVRYLIRSLLARKYIKQDKRDRVEWHNDSATFYTLPEKRREIDRIIESFMNSCT